MDLSGSFGSKHDVMGLFKQSLKEMKGLKKVEFPGDFIEGKMKMATREKKLYRAYLQTEKEVSHIIDQICHIFLSSKNTEEAWKTIKEKWANKLDEARKKDTVASKAWLAVILA